jgi:hypothetical protein
MDCVSSGTDREFLGMRLLSNSADSVGTVSTRRVFTRYSGAAGTSIPIVLEKFDSQKLDKAGAHSSLALQAFVYGSTRMPACVARNRDVQWHSMRPNIEALGRTRKRSSCLFTFANDIFSPFVGSEPQIHRMPHFT